MYERDTQELLNEICQSNDIDKYFNANSNELMKNTFSQYLNMLIDKSKMGKSKIIKESGIERVYSYQIFNGEKHPSRNKILALIFALGAEIDESQRLLYLGGVNKLYPRDKRDSVIIFAIENKKTLNETDEMLFDKCLKTITDPE